MRICVLLYSIGLVELKKDERPRDLWGCPRQMLYMATHWFKGRKGTCIIIRPKDKDKHVSSPDTAHQNGSPQIGHDQPKIAKALQV
jgi:hypothetical protein